MSKGAETLKVRARRARPLPASRVCVLKRARPRAQRGEVKVEIFAAGDGINYPRRGQTVTVHYSGYVRPVSYTHLTLPTKRIV